MLPKYNPIEATCTKPLGLVYPDSGLVLPADDYPTIRVDLDENDNSVVLDFTDGYGTEDARGAVVRFRRRQLTVLIHMLQAAFECLEPGESDDLPAP